MAAGVSALAPALFALAAAAGRHDHHIAYLGFLLGPAAVGLLAGTITLRGGLSAVAGTALVLAAAAGLARPPAGPFTVT